MSLSVSPEIAKNNPCLEIIYCFEEDGFSYYPRCSLIPHDKDSNSDFCIQVEGLTIRPQTVGYKIVPQEFLPNFPITCSECPMYRQYQSPSTSTQS